MQTTSPLLNLLTTNKPSQEATRDATRMADPTVLTMALASALVAVGSCVLNDWFDRRVDRLNKPESALVQGKVPSAHALLISLASLGLAFGTSFVVPAAALKHIVRAAVVAVVLYTPCFKSLPFLKNLVVASVTGGACSHQLHVHACIQGAHPQHAVLSTLS